MKSIMEQASSIIKAIEKAWISADSPKEFSVKVFEKEEKNFFGMTTKPAKIGIFFNDAFPVPVEKSSIKDGEKKNNPNITKPVVRPVKQQAQAPQQTKNREHVVQKQTPVSRPVAAPKQEQRSQEQLQKRVVSASESSQSTTHWTSTLQDAAQAWVSKALVLMNKEGVTFTSEIEGKNLMVTFNKPLLLNPMQEKQLFRSIAHLVIASLRNQYKNEIKDLKIVLIRPV
jgi:hypothetical protein